MQNKRLKSTAGVYFTAGDAARGLKPNQDSDTESVPEISHHYLTDMERVQRKPALQTRVLRWDIKGHFRTIKLESPLTGC